jgi:hypothetical protein
MVRKQNVSSPIQGVLSWKFRHQRITATPQPPEYVQLVLAMRHFKFQHLSWRVLNQEKDPQIFKYIHTVPEF